MFSNEIISAIFQASIVLLLFVLLVGKEILRVIGSERWMKTLNWVIVPTFLLFAITIGSRLASFIY